MGLSTKQLADRQAIIEVIDRYATSLDAKDYQRFMTCFSEDAIVHYSDDLVGPESTAAYAKAALDQFSSTQHLLGNYEINLDGDQATAQTYMHASHITSEGEIWVVGGTYIDRFERRDGEWKIIERTLDGKWSERRKISE